MDRRTILRTGLLALALLALCTKGVQAEEKTTVKVTVISILASDKHTEVDKRLATFAPEVQKKNPNLTGFRVDHTASVFLELGVTKTVELSDGQKMDVTANASQTEKNKVTITVKPPKLDQITYNCVCDRYFSMATQHFTKNKEQLFIAVTGKIVEDPEKKSKPPEKSKSK